MEDVPEGALDPGKLAKQLHLRQNLSFKNLEDDIDHNHIQKIGQATLLSIWAKYIPCLKGLTPRIQKLFTEDLKKHPLRLRKSQYYPLETSDIDESTTNGAQGVLRDISLQLGLEEKDFDELLVPIAGDLLTVDRIKKLQAYTLTDITTYHRHSWAVPWIQLWHMKWAALRTIFHAHWPGDIGKMSCGLQADCETLGRKNINPRKCDFYSHNDLVFDSFEAHCLGALRAVLHSDGITLDPPSEGQHAPDILCELDTLLKHYFSPISLDCILYLAQKAYLRYMVTGAHHAALGDFQRSVELYGQPGSQMKQHHEEAEKHGWDGDRQMANLTLFMRDAGLYYEMCHAIADGDIGRVLEVIKVLRFIFWGAGASNYGKELLSLAAMFIHVFNTKQREAFMNNWLVNLSGKPGQWYELDLLQEHLNFWIKVFYNSRNSAFDTSFLQNVALNITGFSSLRTVLEHILGISTSTGYHHKPNKVADILTLAARHEQEDIFTFHPGRTQPFKAKDMLQVGMEKLRNGDQIRKALASDVTDADDGIDADGGEGTLDGELRGDNGEDNPIPGNLQEYLGLEDTAPQL